MTDITTHKALPTGAITLHRIGRRIDGVIATARDWWRVQQTVTQLRRLSPSQLEDIGLTPGDVDDLARTGRL